MNRSVLYVPIILLALAAPASAQMQPGVRAGVSADPDQFFFGGHIETKPLLEHVTFRPNVEIGFGDDVTLVAINIEFVYSVPIDRDRWRVYFGAGPAAIISSSEGDSHGGGGFNLLIGAQHRGGLFTELKVGTIDSPSLKFTVGYAFRKR